VITLTSCNKKEDINSHPVLPGIILYQTYDWYKNTKDGSCCFSEYYIYENGESYKTSIPTDRPNSMYEIKWLKNGGKIIGLRENEITISDTTGKHFYTLYEIENFRIFDITPSPDNKNILWLNSKIVNHSENPYESFHPKPIIVLFDTILKSTNILIEFKNEERVLLSNQSWSPNCKEFIFTYYQHDNTIHVVGLSNQNTQTTFDASGIYIYNLIDNTVKLLIESGENGVWSKCGRYIGFAQNGDIKVLDLIKNEIIHIRDRRKKESLVSMQWIPDTKILHCMHYYHFMQLDIFTVSPKNRITIFDMDKLEYLNYKHFDKQIIDWK
jgi:hypothetical protein